MIHRDGGEQFRKVDGTAAAVPVHAGVVDNARIRQHPLCLIAAFIDWRKQRKMLNELKIAMRAS